MAKVSSGQRVLAELSADPVALRNKHTNIIGQIDALERRLDYLEGRLENAQKTGNQTVYNAVLKQYQDMANRVQSLATEANSIGESIRYQSDYTNRQQKITDSKPKTTMDKVRESLPYALGSGIRDMIVDTGKGLGQTALYAENAIRGSTLGKNDKGFATLQLGKAGTQGSVMNPEDITMGDVAGEYATALGENTGFYGDVLNSMMHWRQGRLKPDSENEKYAKMFGGAMRDAVGTKPLEDDTVLKGARMVADPFAVLGGGTAVLKTGANAIDNFGDIAKGFRRGDGRYIPRDQLGAIENLWHASPHKFDRFDLSKIGTGEGAQMYGHGGYLAEGKDTGLSYLHQFSKGKATIDGMSIGDMYSQMERKASRLPIDKADAEYAKLDFLEKLDRNVDFDTALSKIDDPNVIAWAKSIRQKYKPDANLYKTRLAWDDAREATDPLSPDHFLHWGKPINEHPQNVLDALEKAGINTMSSADAGIMARGQESYLSNFGIPGIRYLDQGSRGTSGGELLGIINDGGKFKSKIKVSNRGGAQFQSPTDIITTSPPFSTEKEAMDWANRQIQQGSHNYVVFDDKLIDIVERNGVPIKKAKK